jgi:S1-C subfamily serine protease
MHGRAEALLRGGAIALDRSQHRNRPRQAPVTQCAQPHGAPDRAYTRRDAGAMLIAAAALPLAPAPAAGATALEAATPAVAAPGPLTSREQAVVDVFQRCNRGVANIFDITLAGRGLSGPQGVDAPEGNGSGFVWDAAGHVVTNWHVLAGVLSGAGGRLLPGAKVAIVYLLRADGVQQAFDGVLVGADKSRDLAVLRVAAPPDMLRPLPLGDSAALRVGQTVLAIGNPFGFEHTLTVGVVSALGRGFQSMTGSTIGGGIQVDAALNPGNSGGPLLSLDGRVVGVSTAIFTNTGASAGVGFALPSAAAARVVPQLIATGQVLRAALGVQPATDPVARAFNVGDGVLVQTVFEGSAAAAAGLLPTRRSLGGIVAGDVIVGVGGRAVHSAFDLAEILDAAAVGDRVELEVVRAGQRLALTAVLQAEAA